jgi:hypothetical protein
MLWYGGTRRLGWAAAALLAWLALPAAAEAIPPINQNSPELSRAPGSRVITTTSGNWFPDATAYSYEWLRCGPVTCSTTPFAGSSYSLRTADVGRYIRSSVTASNDSGSGAPERSDPLGPIAADPPRNHARPAISGVRLSGETFSSDPGAWSGRVPGDPPFTYEWQRCTTAAAASCSRIAGATRATYTSGAADVGRHIRVVVGAEGLGRAQAASTTLGPVFVPAAAPVKRLTPFPVLVIVGRLRGSRTRITEFVVRAPRRARVSVRCKGRRCPFRLVRGKVGKRKRLRVRRMQRTFRAGQVLEIRVTGRNRIGKFTRVTFRRGRAPRRSDQCLRPPTNTAHPCAELP